MIDDKTDYKLKMFHYIKTEIIVYSLLSGISKRRQGAENFIDFT